MVSRRFRSASRRKYASRARTRRRAMTSGSNKCKRCMKNVYGGLAGLQKHYREKHGVHRHHVRRVRKHGRERALARSKYARGLKVLRLAAKKPGKLGKHFARVLRRHRYNKRSADAHQSRLISRRQRRRGK